MWLILLAIDIFIFSFCCSNQNTRSTKIPNNHKNHRVEYNVPYHSTLDHLAGVWSKTIKKVSFIRLETNCFWKTLAHILVKLISEFSSHFCLKRVPFMKFSSTDPRMVYLLGFRDNFTILHITEHKTAYHIHYYRYVICLYDTLIDAYLPNKQNSQPYYNHMELITNKDHYWTKIVIVETQSTRPFYIHR